LPVQGRYAYLVVCFVSVTGLELALVGEGACRILLWVRDLPQRRIVTGPHAARMQSQHAVHIAFH